MTDGDGQGGAAAAISPRPARLLEPVTARDGSRAPARKHGAMLSLPTRERMERFTEAKRRAVGVRAVSEAHQFADRCVRLVRQQEARPASTGDLVVPSKEQESHNRALALAAEMHLRRAIRMTQQGFVLAMKRGDVGEAMRMCSGMQRLASMAESGMPALGERGIRLHQSAVHDAHQMVDALQQTAPERNAEQRPEASA